MIKGHKCPLDCSCGLHSDVRRARTSIATKSWLATSEGKAVRSKQAADVWAGRSYEERHEVMKNCIQAGTVDREYTPPTEETRVKLAAAARRGPKCDTLPERMMQSALDELHIPYETNVQVGPWNVDLVLDGRVYVEVDGEYWHSLPNMMERDVRKNAWMEDHGFNLQRISESEIYDDVHDLAHGLLMELHDGN